MGASRYGVSIRKLFVEDELTFAEFQDLFRADEAAAAFLGEPQASYLPASPESVLEAWTVRFAPEATEPLIDGMATGGHSLAQLNLRGLRSAHLPVIRHD